MCGPLCRHSLKCPSPQCVRHPIYGCYHSQKTLELKGAPVPSTGCRLSLAALWIYLPNMIDVVVVAAEKTNSGVVVVVLWSSKSRYYNCYSAPFHLLSPSQQQQQHNNTHLLFNGSQFSQSKKNMLINEVRDHEDKVKKDVPRQNDCSWRRFLAFICECLKNDLETWIRPVLNESPVNKDITIDNYRRSPSLYNTTSLKCASFQYSVWWWSPPALACTINRWRQSPFWFPNF